MLWSLSEKVPVLWSLLGEVLCYGDFLGEALCYRVLGVVQKVFLEEAFRACAMESF